MYPYVDSIQVKDGKVLNIQYHQNRVNRTLKELNISANFNLKEILVIPKEFSKGKYKCRFLYNTQNYELEFIPYKKPKIERIKIVTDNNIDYHIKFSNRNHLNRLKELKGDCDDILIVKNGMVTDLSSANIVFKKNQKWYTPSTPLLEGTQREKLIDNSLIIVKDIKAEDIQNYEVFRIINALREFDDENDINIRNIINE